MAKSKAMGKVPSLSGKPAMQAMANSVAGPTMPARSPGKPARLPGAPATKGSTQTAKKAKGKAPPSLKMGNIKGIKRKAVANVKGGSQGRIKSTDMGIG